MLKIFKPFFQKILTLNSLTSFFSKTPALPYAFALLSGGFIPYSLIPLTLFFFPASFRQKGVLLLLTAASFTFFQTYYLFPTEMQTGTCHFLVKEIKKAPRKGWIYRGEIKEFITKEGHTTGKHLPASLFSFSYLEPTEFEIEGTLKPLHAHFYTLKTKQKWNPLQTSWLSLPSKRYGAKRKVQEYVNRVITDPQAAHFLSGLATGELHDRALLKEFEKKGLLHLLAISGFHFAILASFFHVALRPFLSPKFEALTLALFLSIYFAFIGNAASVQRAWIIAMVFLLGQLIERPSTSLNSLAVALVFSWLLDPLTIFNAGFQLSYLATFGILMLYSPLEKGLQDLILKPKFLRQALGLCLAVHLALLPLLFSLFHKVPLHGIAYNLFFPFLVTLSFLLLMIGSFFHLLVPSVGAVFHWLNTHYTKTILHLLDMPLIPSKTLYLEAVNPWCCTLYWTLLFTGAILLRERQEKEKFMFV